MCEIIDFKFFDSIFEADKREVQTKIDNNQIIPQFQTLKKNPCFSELFIVSNDNIDIYKETLIRRIKTRETWKKNPNQIIQEIAGVKPTINKLLNQLVDNNENQIFIKLIKINGINIADNTNYLITQLFNKSLNEKKFIGSILRLIEMLNREYFRKFKIRNFNANFKRLIIEFIENDLKDCEDKNKVETFGLFMKNYFLSNIEKPEFRLDLIKKLIENYSLNSFVVLFNVFIKQEEVIKEIIQLTDKTEEIKKKINVKDNEVFKIFTEYDYDNIFVDVIKTIKENRELYKGKYNFMYFEFTDIYKD